VVGRDFCSACGVKAARRGLGMPSLTSNVLCVMRMLYKNAQHAHSDDTTITQYYTMISQLDNNCSIQSSPKRDLSH